MELCTYTRLRAAKFKKVKRLAKWLGIPFYSRRALAEALQQDWFDQNLVKATRY